MGKFNFNESPVKKVAEDIRDNNEQGRAADADNISRQVEATMQYRQAMGEVMQQAPQPSVASTPSAIGEGRGEGLLGGPLVYNEATKGISVKLPYSLYDALDAIKKQTQRTGNPRDKMGIGDLVVLAVKEFVEKTLPSPPVM